MAEQKIAWQPHPGPQTMALSCPDAIFEILYGGARGGGKTDAGLAWLIGDFKDPEGNSKSLAFHQRYRGLVIRRNADDLSDWLDRARIFYRPFHAEIVGKPAIIRFPNGAIIRTGHLKDDAAYTKYIGHEYHRILIEELTLIPFEIDYLKLISTCRSTIPELRPQIFCTTSPGNAGHQWVKQRFVDPADPYTPFKDLKTHRLRVYIPAKVSDNPTLVQCDPTYVDMLNGLPTELKKAWLDGSWDVYSGQFLSKWRNDIHVVEPFEIPDDWLNLIAIDWGYAAPCAVGWYAKSFKGITYKYRELYVTERDPYSLATEILDLSEKENIDFIVGDPSMWIRNPMAFNNYNAFSDKSIADQMTSAGLYIQKADNNRVNGWTQLRSVLDWEGKYNQEGELILTKEPQYFVFSSCKYTIRLLPALIHDTNRIDDVDKKCEDHIGDCDRYAHMHLMDVDEPAKKPQFWDPRNNDDGIIWAEEKPVCGGELDS